MSVTRPLKRSEIKQLKSPRVRNRKSETHVVCCATCSQIRGSFPQDISTLASYSTTMICSLTYLSSKLLHVLRRVSATMTRQSPGSCMKPERLSSASLLSCICDAALQTEPLWRTSSQVLRSRGYQHFPGTWSLAVCGYC